MKIPAFDQVAVYRFYDRDGSLLYVGMTSSPDSRFADHRRKKPWWKDIDPTRTTLTWFGNQQETAMAEIRAIASEKPKYNVGHGGEGYKIAPLNEKQRTLLTDLIQTRRTAEQKSQAAEAKIWVAVAAARRAGITDAVIRRRTGLAESEIIQRLGSADAGVVY